MTGIPGPESRRLARELRDVESRNVTYVSNHWPVFWERAEGANVWDVDGNRYLDLTSAFAVAGLGHGRRELLEVMQRQAGRLLHGMGDVHPSAAKVELCRKLSEITFERWGAGGARAVLSNSGFEAVETALKTAVLATGRHRVMAFEEGYHGLGYGALMPTARQSFREPFLGQLPSISGWWRYPTTAGALAEFQGTLAATDAGEIGAVVVEPVQGRGGIVVPAAGFLSVLRSWCDERGVLLVFDEIFTGFNRTGELFACEHERVVPDLICFGKAMSGGFPISACLGRAEVMEAWPESDGEALHTSTFLGHPVGCAMAMEAIRLHLEPETRQAVQRVAVALEEMLRALKGAGLREVRGRGTMWGVEIEEASEARRILLEMLRRGHLLLGGGSAGKVLSFTPPFVITTGEIGACGMDLQQILH